MILREMIIEDFDKVHALWMSIHGFGIRSIDDSREGVEAFLNRNPGFSVVAEDDGEIIGSILCGHDGRSACFYHVCVREDRRREGIGKSMTVWCMKKLHEAGKDAVYYKAAMSGNERSADGSLIPGDALHVKNVSGISQELGEMCPYVYETAVSPHLSGKSPL